MNATSKTSAPSKAESIRTAIANMLAHFPEKNYALGALKASVQDLGGATTIRETVNALLADGTLAVAELEAGRPVYQLAEVIAARKAEAEAKAQAEQEADRQALAEVMEQGKDIARVWAEQAEAENAEAKMNAGDQGLALAEAEEEVALLTKALAEAKARMAALRKAAPKAPRKARTAAPAEEVPEGFKRCSVCGELHPVSSFTKDKNQKDGLLRRCRECDITLARARRERKAAAAAVAAA